MRRLLARAFAQHINVAFTLSGDCETCLYATPSYFHTKAMNLISASQMLLALKPPLSRWHVQSAEEDAELDANGPLSEANGLPGLEAEPEASRETTETEAPIQEQLRIAQLAKQGLALVEAALSYGQEGADISAFLTPPPFCFSHCSLPSQQAHLFMIRTVHLLVCRSTAVSRRKGLSSFLPGRQTLTRRDCRCSGGCAAHPAERGGIPGERRPAGCPAEVCTV